LEIVASATVPGFPFVSNAYSTALAPSVVGVATTVKRVPVVVSGFVTVPVPVGVLSGTSPVHPVICASATISEHD